MSRESIGFDMPDSMEGTSKFGSSSVATTPAPLDSLSSSPKSDTGSVVDSDSVLKSNSSISSDSASSSLEAIRQWAAPHYLTSLFPNTATKISTPPPNRLREGRWSSSNFASVDTPESVANESHAIDGSSTWSGAISEKARTTSKRAGDDGINCKTISDQETANGTASSNVFTSGQGANKPKYQLLRPPQQWSSSPYTRAELRHANHGDSDFHIVEAELQNPYYESVEAEVPRCDVSEDACSAEVFPVQNDDHVKSIEKSATRDEAVLIAHRDHWTLVETQLKNEIMSIGLPFVDTKDKNQNKDQNCTKKIASTNQPTVADVAISQVTTPTTPMYDQDVLSEARRGLQTHIKKLTEQVDKHRCAIADIDTIEAGADFKISELEVVKSTGTQYRDLHLTRIAKAEQQKRWALTRMRLAGAENRSEALFELGESFVGEHALMLKPVLARLFDFLETCKSYCNDNALVLESISVVGILGLFVVVMWLLFVLAAEGYTAA